MMRHLVLLALLLGGIVEVTREIFTAGPYEKENAATTEWEKVSSTAFQNISHPLYEDDIPPNASIDDGDETRTTALVVANTTIFVPAKGRDEVVADQNVSALFDDDPSNTSNNQEINATIFDLVRDEPELVVINRNSTIGDDILSIVHFPNSSTLEVTLQHNARCTHPSMVGRLSGPALLSVSWQPPRNSTPGIVLAGTYSSPLDGIFFLELIIIHCDARLFQGDIDVSDVCMEDPFNHRITADRSTISVTKDTASNNNALGYWVHKSYHHKSTAQPVYTRVQRGKSRGDVRGYQAYRFAWKREIVVPKQEKLVNVCFMGDSHSGRGAFAVEEMGFTPATYNINTTIARVKFLEPLFTDKDLWKNLTTCNRIILAAGQWDFSHQHGKAPDTFSNYENNLKHVLEWLHKHFPNVPVLGRNIHFNGLGWKYAGCKPGDWRSPTTVRQMTNIVKRVFEKSEYDQFTFLDTNSVVEPMWDSAWDFSHLSEPTLEAETVLLLSEVLKLRLPATGSTKRGG